MSRKVISISGNVALCDDGTMWEKRVETVGDVRKGRNPWEPIKNVPQGKEDHANLLNDERLRYNRV